KREVGHKKARYLGRSPILKRGRKARSQLRVTTGRDSTVHVLRTGPDGDRLRCVEISAQCFSNSCATPMKDRGFGTFNGRRVPSWRSKLWRTQSVALPPNGKSGLAFRLSARSCVLKGGGNSRGK